MCIRDRSSISFGKIPLKEGVQKETDLTLQTAKEIAEYLAGERTAFDLPLRPEGTPFQKRVWEALLTIPYAVSYTHLLIEDLWDADLSSDEGRLLFSVLAKLLPLWMKSGCYSGTLPREGE